MLAVALFVAARQIRPAVRAEVVRELSIRLDSQVTLEDLDIRLFPRPSVSGRGLVIRHKGRTDIPPLVTVSHFSGHTTWPLAFAGRLTSVQLDGLEVVIPPRRRADMPSLEGSNEPRPDTAAEPLARLVRVAARQGNDEPPPESTAGTSRQFGVNELTTTNGRLTIMSRREDKDPLVFDIHSLVIGNLTLVDASTYEADLTNPIPFGRVQSKGSFGPWAKGEPSDTPIEGTYVFEADLGTIKGIAGALHADGSMEGTIGRITTTGTTTTPDFSIPKLKAAALPLSTSYQASVDGTNGDVELERVEAKLAESHFLAKGSIVGTKGIKGKHVVLDVTSEDARMEDMLALTIKHSPPAMTGAVRLQTSLDLPQGEPDVIDRLMLDGKVRIASARFTSDNVQERVDDLSRRGSGRPEDGSIQNVASDLSADFVMKNAQLVLSNLTYSVPGAKVAMSGTFAFHSGALDFGGVATLDASASETQTGFRHFLLKPFDKLLRKDGAGTRVALTVGGTVDDPKVGVDFNRTLKGK